MAPSPTFILPRNIAIVANPLHPKALSVANAIHERLEEKALEHTVFTEHWPADWTDFTEAWVVGGDGTLNYFINRYPQFHLPMALFKGGTGNDFHGLLYGRFSVDEQVIKVLAAEPRPVDAGLCNHRLFIKGVGIGFDGKLVNDRAGPQKTKTFFLSILKNIFGYKTFLCTVKAGEFHWGKKCFMISIANGRRYGGGFHVLPNNLVSDGLLDTNIVGKIHPLFRLRYLSLIRHGRQLNLPLVTYVKSAMVIVKATQPVPAHLDGEPLLATEFIIECLPGRFFFLY